MISINFKFVDISLRFGEFVEFVEMSRRMSMPTTVVDKPEKVSELKALFAARMGSDRRSSLIPVQASLYGRGFSGSWVPRTSGIATNDVTRV